MNDKQVEDAHYRALKRIEREKSDALWPFAWCSMILGVFALIACVIVGNEHPKHYEDTGSTTVNEVQPTPKPQNSQELAIQLHEEEQQKKKEQWERTYGKPPVDPYSVSSPYVPSGNGNR